MSNPIRIPQPDIDDPYYRPVESLYSDDESGSGKSSGTTVTDAYGIFDFENNSSSRSSSDSLSSRSLSSRSLSSRSPESLSSSPFSSHTSSPRIPTILNNNYINHDMIGNKRKNPFHPTTNVPILRQKFNHHPNGGKRKTRKGKNKSAKRNTRKGKNKSAKRNTRKGKNKSAKRSSTR
jgi:hypothetical protein